MRIKHSFSLSRSCFWSACLLTFFTRLLFHICRWYCYLVRMRKWNRQPEKGEEKREHSQENEMEANVWAFTLYALNMCSYWQIYLWVYDTYMFIMPLLHCMCIYLYECACVVATNYIESHYQWTDHANTRTHKHIQSNNNVTNTSITSTLYYLFVFWMHQYHTFTSTNIGISQSLYCIRTSHTIAFIANFFYCVEIAQFSACECVARVD